MVLGEGREGVGAESITDQVRLQQKCEGCMGVSLISRGQEQSEFHRRMYASRRKQSSHARTCSLLRETFLVEHEEQTRPPLQRHQTDERRFDYQTRQWCLRLKRENSLEQRLHLLLEESSAQITWSDLFPTEDSLSFTVARKQFSQVRCGIVRLISGKIVLFWEQELQINCPLASMSYWNERSQSIPFSTMMFPIRNGKCSLTYEAPVPCVIWNPKTRSREATELIEELFLGAD